MAQYRAFRVDSLPDDELLERTGYAIRKTTNMIIVKSPVKRVLVPSQMHALLH